VKIIQQENINLSMGKCWQAEKICALFCVEVARLDVGAVAKKNGENEVLCEVVAGKHASAVYIGGIVVVFLV